MPLSSDSVRVRPITCVGPRFGHGDCIVRMYRVNANQTLIKGDVVELSSSKVSKSADSVDLSTINVVGVVANDKTTGGTVGERDVVNVYDAAANIFEANMLGNETNDTDLTDRSAFFISLPILFANVAPAPTAGQFAINDSALSANDAIVIGLSPTQVQFDVIGADGKPGTGVGTVSEGSGTFSDVQVGDKIPRAGAHTGILNPRVLFIFRTVHPSIGYPLVA